MADVKSKVNAVRMNQVACIEWDEDISDKNTK